MRLKFAKLSPLAIGTWATSTLSVAIVPNRLIFDQSREGQGAFNTSDVLFR
jgi:hypothetical protein